MYIVYVTKNILIIIFWLVIMYPLKYCLISFRVAHFSLLQLTQTVSNFTFFSSFTVRSNFGKFIHVFFFFFFFFKISKGQSFLRQNKHIIMNLYICSKKKVKNLGAIQSRKVYKETIIFKCSIKCKNYEYRRAKINQSSCFFRSQQIFLLCRFTIKL